MNKQQHRQTRQKILDFAPNIFWLYKKKNEPPHYCEYDYPLQKEQLTKYCQNASIASRTSDLQYVDKSQLTSRQRYIFSSEIQGDTFLPTMWEVLSVIPYKDLKGVTAIQVALEGFDGEKMCIGNIITYSGSLKLLNGSKFSAPQSFSHSRM